jgi:predicted XRE-type DNA-binding protein
MEWFERIKGGNNMKLVEFEGETLGDIVTNLLAEVERLNSVVEDLHAHITRTNINRKTRILTIEHKNHVLSLLEMGWTQTKIAKLYGVTQPSVSYFIKRIRQHENNRREEE